MIDLVEIESDPHHRPESRTACQRTTCFAARSEATSAPTVEESATLEAFVAVLGEQK